MHNDEYAAKAGAQAYQQNIANANSGSISGVASAPQRLSEIEVIKTRLASVLNSAEGLANKSGAIAERVLGPDLKDCAQSECNTRPAPNGHLQLMRAALDELDIRLNCTDGHLRRLSEAL